MASNQERIVKLLEQAPLPHLVESLSSSLADAQNQLTMKAIDALIRLSDPENGIQLPGETHKRSLLELGFEPSFLHITEATISARVAFTCAEGNEWTVGGNIGVSIGVFSASINASYTNKYSFESEGASEVKARIVSIPAPAGLSERMRQAAKKNGAGGGGTAQQ